MELSIVIGIIVIIVAIVLLMKVMGKVVSLIFSIVGIIAVVVLVVVGMRYLDESNVRDNLLDSNSLFLLEDDGNLLTGFATQEGMPDPDMADIEEEIGSLDNPNSEIYDDYYKVIVVKKEALPEKTALLVDVSDEEDRHNLFKSYVDNELLEGDFVSNLVEEEKEGNIEVHKETLAFRHGLKEVIKS
jgi:energy-coupling factor transporter transmembrane protein EcfT